MNLTVLALTLAIAAPQAVGTPAPQAGAAEPLALLKARTAEVKALMGQPPDDARKAALRKLVGGIVDYHALAQSSLKTHWGERTPEERIEFESLLRQLIEKSYLEQIERQPDFQVKWEGSKLIKKGARAKVKTVATAGKTSIEVEYRLVRQEPHAATRSPPVGKAGPAWIIADIAIDEVSMVRNYRKSFSRVIRKDGYPALVSKMRSKLND